MSKAVWALSLILGSWAQGGGRPGSSVQWGAWGGGGGMAAQVTGFMERMARIGLGVLPPATGLAVLANVLQAAWAPRLQTGSPITVGEASNIALSTAPIWLLLIVC